MVYNCPHCSKPFQSEGSGFVLCPSCGGKVELRPAANIGCAWDRAEKGGWFAAFIDTFKRSLLEPVAFFTEVSEGQGYLRPLVYAIIVFAVMLCSTMLYQAGFGIMTLGLGTGLGLNHDTITQLIPMTAISLPLTIMLSIMTSVIAVPILAAICVFMGSCICHLGLMVVGGPRRDFLSTFRAICYCTGPQLFQIVPFAGALVAFVWQIILQIVGLKVVHRTSYGRSTLAIFLPTIICCGGIVMILLVVAGGITAAFMGAVGK